MVCLRAVPLIHLPNLEVLLGAVGALPIMSASDVVTLLDASDGNLLRDLLQKVVDLHPRVDRPGCFGFPVSQLEAEQVFVVFFENGGQIHALNAVRSQDGESGETEEFPPFSSGDLVDDWLADLTCSFQGNFSEALALVSCRDVNGVMGISRRLGDLWMGKEKREERGLRKWFKEWEKENQDVLDDVLFGGLDG